MRDVATFDVGLMFRVFAVVLFVVGGIVDLASAVVLWRSRHRDGMASPVWGVSPVSYLIGGALLSAAGVEPWLPAFLVFLAVHLVVLGMSFGLARGRRQS